MIHEFYLSGQIGQCNDPEDHSEYISFNSVQSMVNSVPKENSIKFYLTSQGGNVVEAINIHNFLKKEGMERDIHCEIFGICMSAANLITAAMKIGNLSMAKNAMMMIHEISMPYPFFDITVSKMDELRPQMDYANSLIAQIMADRCGMTVDDFRAKYMYGTDQYLMAEEALAAKLIDKIENYETVEIPNIEAISNGTSFAMALKSHYNSVLSFVNSKKMTKNKESTATEEPKTEVAAIDKENAMAIAQNLSENLNAANAEILEKAEKISELEANLEKVKADHASELRKIKAELAIKDGEIEKLQNAINDLNAARVQASVSNDIENTFVIFASRNGIVNLLDLTVIKSEARKFESRFVEKGGSYFDRITDKKVSNSLIDTVASFIAESPKYKINKLQGNALINLHEAGFSANIKNLEPAKTYEEAAAYLAEHRIPMNSKMQRDLYASWNLSQK